MDRTLRRAIGIEHSPQGWGRENRGMDNPRVREVTRAACPRFSGPAAELLFKPIVEAQQSVRRRHVVVNRKRLHRDICIEVACAPGTGPSCAAEQEQPPPVTTKIAWILHWVERNAIQAIVTGIKGLTVRLVEDSLLTR
jgi:hypothetical protein